MKDADADLVADLDARGLLLRAEVHRHSYPHCWRCGTPLLYYAKPSWYIRTTAVRDRMLDAELPHRLAPRARARRTLRALAGGQRQLGDLARPLLGHPAAPLALRRVRPRGRGRVVRRAARARHRAGAGRPRPPPALRGRRAPRLRVRRRDAPRAGGHRRLVRQRGDALRAGAPPHGDGRRPLGAAAGRLRVRGARPDAGMVLLAAGRERAALRRDRLPQRGVPRPDPRRRGPEDEQDPRQRHRAVDRASSGRAPTPSAGTCSRRRAPGSRSASASRRWTTPSASSC